MAITFHKPQVHFFHRDPAHKLGVVPLYWSMFLIRLAQNFTGIFIPVYLFQVGLGIFGKSEVVSALAFLLVLLIVKRLTAAVSVFPAAWAAREFGFRWMIFFSGVMRAVVFILFLLGASNVWLLAAGMMIWGVVIATFWPSFHTVFAEDGEVAHFGKSVSLRIIAEMLAGVIGPIAGGVVVAMSGFSNLFIVGVVLVLFSSAPVFFMRRHNHADKVSLRELGEWLGEKRFVRAGISFVGYHLHNSTLAFLWPVFIFLAVTSYQKLGAVFSIAALVAVVMSFLVGKLFDKGHRKNLFQLGSMVTAVLWLARASLRVFGQIVVVDAIERGVSMFYRLPYLAYSYKRARGRQAFSFMVYREFLISLGAVGFWLLSMVLLFFPWFWFGVFGLAALGVLVSQFILEGKE